MSIKLKSNKYLLYILLCIIWSTTWSVIKIGLDGTPPVVGLATRFAIASAILFLIIIFKKIKIVINKETVKLYLMVGVFNMAISYFCTYWGTQFIPSGLTSIIWSGMPLLTGICAHFVIHEDRLGINRIIAILVSMCGMILILSDQKLLFKREMVIGSFVVVFAVIFGVLPNIYTKIKGDIYNPIVLTAVSLAIAAIFHSVLATFLDQWQFAVWGTKNIFSIVYLGVFGSAVTFSIYFTLLKQISVIKMSFITFITPVFATIIGAVILKEIITVREIIGMLIIFTGIFLYDFKKYKKIMMKFNG